MIPKITFEYEDDSFVRFYQEDGQWYHQFKDKTTNNKWTQGYPNTRTMIVEFLENALGREKLRAERS